MPSLRPCAADRYEEPLLSEILGVAFLGRGAKAPWPGGLKEGNRKILVTVSACVGFTEARKERTDEALEPEARAGTGLTNHLDLPWSRAYTFGQQLNSGSEPIGTDLREATHTR